MTSLTTLMPKRRAEVFRILFADASQSFHLREIARLGGVAVGALSVELARLRETGLLQERRDGNRLYYQANTGHPLYPELHGLVAKTTGLEAQLSRALDGVPGITLAFVFGSCADGRATPGSDVDLFVAGSIGLRKLVPRLRPVATALGREINPYVTEPQTLAHKAKCKDAFLKSVLSAPKRWIIGTEDELARLAK